MAMVKLCWRLAVRTYGKHWDWGLSQWAVLRWVFAASGLVALGLVALGVVALGGSFQSLMSKLTDVKETASDLGKFMYSAVDINGKAAAARPVSLEYVRCYSR